MAGQVQTATHPDRPLRWLMVPAIGGALLAAVTAVWRRGIRPESLTPVSDEWLRAHDVRAGREGQP